MTVRAPALFGIMAFALVGGSVLRSGDGSTPVLAEADEMPFYEKLPRMHDPERRLNRLASDATEDVLDVSALVGMPIKYRRVLAEYAEGILAAIHATPLTRQRFYNENVPGRSSYPSSANPVYDKDTTIPIAILPRPDAIRTWSRSSKAQASGWRTRDQALEEPESIYGLSMIFEAGALSKNPITIPAVPFEQGISLGLFVYGNCFLKLGKVVTSPTYDAHHDGDLKDETEPLQWGKKGGAKLLGKYLTTSVFPANVRLRWTEIQVGEDSRQFLAYALIDGNGAARDGANHVTSSGISCFVRPLTCAQHQPKVQQHDELLLPTPKGWPPNLRAASEVRLDRVPHEEWCLDDWFPAQKDACWVIREAKDSKPLQESFLLMPAREASDRPVFFIALFAETEPRQLVSELAALYKVSSDAALSSPETMQRLNSLYEAVLDFPLAD